MPYYRSGDSGYYRLGAGGITPTVKKLITINIVIFLIQLFIASGIGFIRLFGLVPAYVFARFMPWQLVTYMFLHGGLFHLAFNMFALWMFGTDIERTWGARRFLFYYFFTGIGAGICTYFSAMDSVIPTIGASGAIFGILVAYGMMFPDRIIFVSLIFPMKARHVVILFAVMEFLASLSHTPDGIGHFAHLGGMLFGYLYLKNQNIFNNIIPKVKFMDNKKDENKYEEADFFENEIDPILDKISKYGIESLTKRELKILKNAKDKMIH